MTGGKRLTLPLILFFFLASVQLLESAGGGCLRVHQAGSSPTLPRLGVDRQMMELVVTSSARVRMVGQLVLKVKYCHPVFEECAGVKERCETILREVLARNGVAVEAVGFDANHVHFLLNLAGRHLATLVKCLKGETGRKLLREFPAMKSQYFWGSGFWNPSYYFDSGGRFDAVRDYVLDQALTRKECEREARERDPQRSLTSYFAV